MKILYEDEMIIVLEKPVGVASQNERGFAEDMVGKLMAYRKRMNDQDTYIGVVHRLDKMVGGVMVYAKTKVAAAELSRQVANGEMSKCYYAVVKGRPEPATGQYVDYLRKDGKLNMSEVVDSTHKDAKVAELKYQVLDTVYFDEMKENYSLVDVELLTGRHHQIRVQFSHHGFPLAGDRKYHAKEPQTKFRGVGLYSYTLKFKHPKTKKQMEFVQKPEYEWFNRFQVD